MGTLPPVPPEARWWWRHKAALAALGSAHSPVYVYNRDVVDRKLQELSGKLAAITTFFFAMKVVELRLVALISPTTPPPLPTGQQPPGPAQGD